MARDNYNMAIKVKQSTIDDMKKMGMSKALERANKGDAGDEFYEAAKRFYGKRVKARPKPVEKPRVEGRKPDPSSLPKTKEKSAVVGEAAAETAKPTRVYEEPKKKMSINARFRKAVLGKPDKVKLF